MSAVRTALLPGLCGVLFGFGLALSGMVDPRKVLGFLDVTGAWDPTLAFVMAGALAVSVPAFAVARRRKRPFAAAAFSWPERTDVDARLLGGALMFGVGWGLSGFCPGPALASLGLAQTASYPFVLALVAGTVLARRLDTADTRAAELEPREGTS